MLGVGNRIPGATVWAAPGEAVLLTELAAERSILLFFYLFDFSST